MLSELKDASDQPGQKKLGFALTVVSPAPKPTPVEANTPAAADTPATPAAASDSHEYDYDGYEDGWWQGADAEADEYGRAHVGGRHRTEGGPPAAAPDSGSEGGDSEGESSAE